MAKYGIIKKETGLFDGIPSIYDDTSRPINENELEYVQLTDRMIAALTTFEEVIDQANTKYLNGSWVESYITPVKVDILANRTRDKNNFIAEAQRRLSVPDISDAYRTALQNYISELEAIIPTNEEYQTIVWPAKPF